MSVTRAIVLALSLIAGASGAECPPISDPRAVESLQQLPVSGLEEGMPDEPFGEWLAARVGERAVCWEANDCGEQTGDPEIDRTRDIPLCVEAWVADSAGPSFGVVVTVGTWRQGVHGAARLRQVYRQEGEELSTLESLRDLEDLLER